MVAYMKPPLPYIASQVCLQKNLRLDKSQLPRIVRSYIEGKNKNIEYEIIPLNPALAFSITSLLRSPFTDDFHVTHTKSKSYDSLCDVLQYLSAPNIYEVNDVKPLSSYEKFLTERSQKYPVDYF